MDARGTLRHLLAETDDLLARTELDLRRLEAQVQALQAERQGLRLALARHGDGDIASPAVVSGPPATPGEPAGASGQPPWPHLSRAEAVMAVLVEQGHPLSRLEIVERLAAVGRAKDDADAVSAALAYLRRTAKVERVGGGQWALKTT